MQLATGFNRLVADYIQYLSKVVIYHLIKFSHFHSWSPALPGWFKVNFDAYVVVGANRGLGAVVQDDKGTLLVAGVRRMLSKWFVNVPEAIAAHFGVELAVRFGYNNVILEGTP